MVTLKHSITYCAIAFLNFQLKPPSSVIYLTILTLIKSIVQRQLRNDITTFMYNVKLNLALFARSFVEGFIGISLIFYWYLIISETNWFTKMFFFNNLKNYIFDSERR